ncbi:MAG: ABC transporter permease [Gammaproteobacteria bacterium]|nr:ABC transporter permease [Gammaproteobacteria bacterium]MDH3449990.1 ABC transporter permease [Gammaproteobacteria bacterium]
MAQFTNIIRLSFRDYSHEWRMSGCFIMALASVLAPMMILFGLKFGIVSSMVLELVENPANREIRPIGSGRYDDAWIDAYRNREDVEFIIPKTRALAATIQLKSTRANRILSTELLATAAGDPLLQAIVSVPQDYHQVILSDAAADKLNVGAGDEVDASLSRQFQGKRERVHLPLTVIDIADATVTGRNVAFVSLNLLIASEKFKDGRIVSELGWGGSRDYSMTRIFPSFRLYARSIYDVETLVDELEQQGVRVKANVGEIKTVQSIDQNLSVIFWIIACVGALGFSFSLGASLWANVDRKRKELSVLRLVGFKSGRIVLFPVMQSLYTGLLGWLMAVLIYLLFEYLINNFLAPRLNLDQALCYLLVDHFLWALALTVVVAILAAIIGGMRAARIEPSDGLRDV